MKKYYIIGVCNFDTNHVAFIVLDQYGPERKKVRFKDTSRYDLGKALKFRDKGNAVRGAFTLQRI